MGLRVVGFSPRHSWLRVLLVSLLGRVVDVMVLLWLLVLPGVVVDANGEGVVGRRYVALWCRWH